MNGTQRKTLIGINAGISLAHVGNYIYFPILVSVLGSTYSGFWAGFVMFMTYVGRLLATFFYEGFTVRLGNRNNVIAGVALEALALGLMGFGSGVTAFSVLAFFVGFGSGMSFPGLKNILSTFPDESRPKAFTWFQMSCQLGAIGGALAGGLFAGVDLKILFSVVFALFLAYCLAAISLIPKSLADTIEDSAQAKPPLFSAAVLKGLRVGSAARYFLLSSVFWFLSMNFLVGMPLHMQAYVPGWSVSVPFWITGVTLLALQVPLFRFMIKRLKPGHVMAMAFVAMTTAYCFFGFGRTAIFVVVGCVIVVMGEILFTPSFDMWVSSKIPSDRLAKAMGAMHFFRSFGNLIGSIGAGLLYDLSRSTGSPGVNWLIVGVVAIGCALATLSGARKEARAEQLAPEPAVAG